MQFSQRSPKHHSMFVESNLGVKEAHKHSLGTFTIGPELVESYYDIPTQPVGGIIVVEDKDAYRLEIQQVTRTEVKQFFQYRQKELEEEREAKKAIDKAAKAKPKKAEKAPPEPEVTEDEPQVPDDEPTPVPAQGGDEEVEAQEAVLDPEFEQEMGTGHTPTLDEVWNRDWEPGEPPVSDDPA